MSSGIVPIGAPIYTPAQITGLNRAVPNQTRLFSWQSSLSLSLGTVSGICVSIPCTLAEPASMPLIDNPTTTEEMRADPNILNEAIIPVWQLEETETTAPEFLSDPIQPNREEPVEVFPKIQLSGEAVFSFIHTAGDRPHSDQPIQPSLGNRLRLNIETSFSGDDLLRLRFQTTNVTELDEVFETDLARLSIQGEDQNRISLSRLDYQFAIGNNTEMFVQAIGGSISDIADPLNPLFSSSGQGAISRFGQRNPLYRQGGNAGIGLSHDFSDRINLSLGYLGDDQNLFSDEESAVFAQLTVEPADQIKLGLLYIYGLNGLDSGTGSQQANDPFADQSDAISSHSIGLQATADVTDQLTVSGWAGYTRATATDLPDRPQADILNWAITLGYDNLFSDHNLGGLIIGRPPHVISTPNQTSPAWHMEVFYQIRLNEQITITPGIVVVTNPESDSNRSPIVIGTLRTRFSF